MEIKAENTGNSALSVQKPTTSTARDFFEDGVAWADIPLGPLTAQRARTSVPLIFPRCCSRLSIASIGLKAMR